MSKQDNSIFDIIKMYCFLTFLKVLDNILAGRMRMIGLETEDVSILLSENENLEGYNSEEVQMVGYPGLPYSRRISELLTLWLETGLV